MSTFAGMMNEFAGISIDRFDNDNLNSKIFFLSHCHMDHMVGLNDPNGIPGPLYVSPITSIIIRKQFPQIKDIVVLKANGKRSLNIQFMLCNVGHSFPLESTPIKYTNVDGMTQYVTVTTLPAFHCPGSVMFLFEQENVKVLYTGDFR